MPWDDIVLDIGDEEKQVVFGIGFNGMLTESIY